MMECTLIHLVAVSCNGFEACQAARLPGAGDRSMGRSRFGCIELNGRFTTFVLARAYFGNNADMNIVAHNPDISRTEFSGYRDGFLRFKTANCLDLMFDLLRHRQGW